MKNAVFPRILAVVAVLVTAGLSSVQAQTSLISTGATWKYLDNGSDPGTAWRATNFNDSGWSSGEAQFGYGDLDIVTTNNFGPDPNNKFITTYYRHAFVLANPATLTNLLLRLIRDDGAAVYLNGVEVFRDNLPAGALTFTTVALGAIADADESTFILTNPPPSLLVGGTNVLAVEIHQNATNSSDLSFDLELLANFTAVPPAVAITSPADGATVASLSVNLVASASDVDGAITKVEFFQASTKIGEDTTAPYNFVATGLTPGTYTFSARATDSTGLSTDSASVQIFVVAPAPTLVALSATWKYLATNAAGAPAGNTWTTLAYDDSAWLSGPGELGYGDNDEATVITFGPDTANKYPTTYFRHKFVVNDPNAYASLSLSLTYDDGPIVYLNGVEVYRLNMAAGTATYATLALGAADYTPDISALPTSALVAGTNILAVEMHQGSANSSDLSLAVQIQGILPPTVAITSPADGATHQVPVNFNVNASASDSDGTVTRVDFYEGFALLGSDTTSPFSIAVSNLMEGLHVLTAVATDNSGATGTSAPVSVQVVDLNPPTLVSASGASNRVTVVFSKRVVEPSATTAGNYGINNGVIVQSAAYGQSSNVIVLTTTPLSSALTYTLTVNNVRDSANNPIAPNSQIPFQVVGFIAGDVGGPTVGGSTTVVPGGYDVAGAGTDIAGTSDQFHFNYEADQRFGDFDVQVRLAGFSGADAWSKAALMARETLAGNSRYAASVATPSISGCFFQYRSTAGGGTTNAGFAPATYPNLRLRLKRQGNLFTGYTSADGATWQTLGSVTLALPSNLYIGMAVSSHNASQTATAQFRDFANSAGGPIASAVLTREPLGPSSRRTGLAISEILYNPRVVPGFSNSLEFIEIFNGQAYFENIGGYRLSGAVNYTFPPGTVLQSGTFLVVARDPAFVQSHYAGLGSVLGPWEGANTNGLPGDSGLVRLRGKADEVLLEVNYKDGPPWPVAADGTGHSLVLARPSYGENDPRAWDASDAIDGSPGRQDPFPSDPMRNVVINEFLAHTDLPQVDFVELYNHGNQAVDLSGAWLSDQAGTNKHRIPNGTSLGPRSYISFNVSTNTTGFALSSTGEKIFLVNSNRNRVIDAVDFGPQENGVSTGRYPDGAPSFYRMASLTAGTNNAGLRMADNVVINEIMYSPISGDNDDEYVELYNRGNVPMNLGGWRLQAGIEYTFPENVMLPTNAYLVVAKNPQRLMANHGGLTVNNTYGPFSGSLANSGERLALARTDFEVVTNNNIVGSNVHYVVVNEVTYGDSGKWGWWSDGGGSSLELKDPRSDNRQPANWADSDETSKGIWTTIQLTGNIGETLGSPINDNLQLILLGIGECLVDEVEVRNNAGPNLLTANPGFETGTATAESVGMNLGGWIAQGSHDHSSFENVGFAGARSLHLRAASRGDNGGNRIRSQPIAASGTVTVRCKVKWLRGWPELLLRLHGGGFEVGGRMQILPNLGTPGAANSAVVANTGPAVYDVAHSPVLPAASEAVVVSCRASDPQTFTLSLKYRIDPTAVFTTVAMQDNGTGADSIARDGTYSATIPAQSAGAMAAFYIEATDSLGGVNRFPQDVFPTAPLTRVFPLDAMSRECLIRWGETQMLGSFATYHLWVNANNVTRWTNRRPLLNNSSLDGTFVYNNYRVIYNMMPQYAGSPWHRGQMTTGPAGGQRVDYDIEFPEDDRLLGATDFVWNNPGNPGGTSTSDLSAQSEQTSYEIFKQIAVHYNHRRYVHVFVNGSQRSTTANRPGNFIMEDSQQPNGDVINQWFPDDPDGTLYKIEDWFEFPDNGDDFVTNNDADLQRRQVTTNGMTTLHSGAYRFMWRPRARGVGESAVDYGPLFGMINLVTPGGDTADVNLPAVDSVLDYEQWMRVFACQHTVGNWDAYGYNRGKNAYTYVPGSGKFNQWTWDIDFTMGVGGDGASTDLFGTTDPRVAAMWRNPAILRAYWRAYFDIIAGPLNSSYMDPIIDAKAAAMVANAVNYDPGTVSTIKGYVTARRNYLQGRLTTLTNQLFAFAGAPVVTISSNFMTISGSAPIQVKDIYINGVLYTVTWTSVSNWTARVALNPGTNTLRISAVDLRGNSIGSTQTVTGIYTGAAQQPQDFIVINEIMSNPSFPGAEFVELFNTSSNFTFDLSGWEFSGLDYDFPGGSLMPPRSFFVLTRDVQAFANAYGGTAPTHGQFDGNLQANGETISLIKPAVTNAYMTNAVEVVVDRVRYEPVRPWPVGTNGVPSFSSIQLIDARQDNSRPCNWSTLYHPPVFSPATNFPGSTNAGWRFFSWTATSSATASNDFKLYLTLTGAVVIDRVFFVTGTVAEAGANLLVNGDFESGSLAPWFTVGNASNTAVTADAAYSGTGAVRLRVDNQGAIGNRLAQTVYNVAPIPHTVSFWFLSTNTTSTLEYHYNSQIRTANPTTNTPINVGPLVTPPFSNPPMQIAPALYSYTPGSNNVRTTNITAIPAVWLNEVQTSNTVGLLDNAGDRDPWIELYNSSTNVIPLAGLYLANNYTTNLTQWQFPAGSSIAPGEYKIVWADGEPGETSGTNLHTSFRLGGTAGSLALVRISNNTTQVLDYLSYVGAGAALAYGDFPDAQPFYRQTVFTPTPRSANLAQAFPLFVNEWMAGNTNFVIDPADGNFDDWFEIYNAGLTDLDLGGFYLTDDAGDPTKFRVPDNGQYVIPPGGFLLVWADNETNQNTSATNTLHARFQLSVGGDRIEIYAPDGETLVHSLVFGQQTNNLSQGRFADGSSALYFMTMPTPGSANTIGGPLNTAPVIPPIATRTNRVGQNISFQITATDAEVPPQVLTYSLLGFPPSGAGITSGGLFNWTPDEEYGYTTNVLTVRARDDGSPALSATRNFTIIVLPALTASLSTSGNTVTISFDTIPGRTYRVDYKNSLNDEMWTPLAPAAPAAGSTVMIMDDMTGRPHRFYRIEQTD